MIGLYLPIIKDDNRNKQKPSITLSTFTWCFSLSLFLSFRLFIISCVILSVGGDCCLLPFIPISRSLFNKSIINCAKKSRLNNLMMVFIGKLKVNYRSQALFLFLRPFVHSFHFGFSHVCMWMLYVFFAKLQ